MSSEPDIYYHPHVAPALHSDDGWEVFPCEPPPDEHKWVNAHHRMARSMIDRIEGRDREYTLLEGRQARKHLTWAMAAHASHVSGARVSLPQDISENPFDTWR